ncbi:MAG: ribose-phosphate pyrophosphokinase-like domain-containing protein [Patescibacteria group bacterium]|jgi:phosphoribosylpyrophosphate synthetase
MPKGKVIVLSCPAMEKTAQAVSEALRHYPVEYHPSSWGVFSDGFPDISINAEAVRNNHVWFFASLENPSEIFHQFSVLWALPRYGAKSLRVVLPFYPTGTMERKIKVGDIVTAKSLARMFDAIPGNAGTPRIFIFDIHDLREEFYFSDNTLVCLQSAVPRLLGNFYGWSVAFPDEGAQKRFGKVLDNFPQLTCQKVRQGDERIVTLKEGEARDRNILIVDDLTRTGGTLIECAKVLKHRGAATINLVVPHAAVNVQAVNWLIKAHKQGLINRLYTTDSCPTAIKLLAGLDFVFVKSLSELITKMILQEEF